MKINCSACGAQNDNSDSECQYCGASMIAPSKKKSNNSSDSLLSKGVAFYKKENYNKAEEVFLEILEGNQNDTNATLYLALTLNAKSGDFLILTEDITELLKSTNNEDQLNIIYQKFLLHIEALLKPKIKRIGTTKSEIEFDYIASTLRSRTYHDEDVNHEELEKLTALFELIATFPNNHAKLFLQMLIKRYQYPWASSVGNPSWCWPIYELVLIKELNAVLKENISETKLLFSTISDIHVQVIKRYLEMVKAGEDPHKFLAQTIIEWNDKINNFFDSFDFTESELGFSHTAKIEPYLLDLNKYLASNSENSESKGSKPGCFIATAAMGDYNHPVVVDLRNFRDDWLLQRNWGVKFTNWYYTHGPKAANVIDKSKWLKKTTYALLVKPLHLLTKFFK